MDPSGEWGIVQEKQEVKSPIRAQSVWGTMETSKRMVGKEWDIWIWSSGRGVKSWLKDGNKWGYLGRGMTEERKFWLLQDGEHPGPEKDLPMTFNLASDYFLISLVKTKSLSITELCLVLGSLIISFSQPHSSTWEIEFLPLDRCLLWMNWVKISVFWLVSTCIGLETWPRVLLLTTSSSHWMLPTDNQQRENFII